MTFTLRRAAVALLLFWAFSAVVVSGHIGWVLLLLTGAWLLSRTTDRAAARHAAPTQVPARPVQAVSPMPQEPYWLMAAGTAAVLHSRDREAAPAADDSAEEDDCLDEMYDVPAGAAPAAAEWDGQDDADLTADFGGYGGGGGWGDGDDFGGYGGGGDWGDDE